MKTALGSGKFCISRHLFFTACIIAYVCVEILKKVYESRGIAETGALRFRWDTLVM